MLLSGLEPVTFRWIDIAIKSVIINNMPDIDKVYNLLCKKLFQF
jgi:hypothetical protein